jgi:serine/threonine-protein kinase
MAQHGNDAEQSLAAISSASSVREQLQQLTDPDVQASLSHLGTSPVTGADDPYATRVSTIGTGQTPGKKTGPVTGGAPSTGPASLGESSSTGLRFRILRPHAHGGLGEVLVARDEELNREVALKQIRPNHANDPESQGRFMLEAEITGGLEHPSIVPVYGLGHYADGRPFYAMRFIRGDSLKEAIDRFHKADRVARDPGERSLELHRLLRRFIDVCNAIAYAHSRGVLHRDLKPGNIMLGKYGETLVVDWGLAKTLDQPDEPLQRPVQPGEGTLRPSSASYASQTVMGAAVGTPQFMSPEQAAGRLDLLGPASDVYSLGATLYPLLTGIAPITDSDLGTVLQKVQRGDIARPRQVKPNVPPPLEAICMKAMAVKPADRYITPRELADDIEHWLADEPVSAWPEPWTVKARRWISRNRMKVTAVASAVVMAAIVLGIAAVREHGLRLQVEEERDAKEKQRQLAEHNYRLARSAVDRYHTGVSENELLNDPGMEGLRKQLLGNAREFYAQFVKEHADDPSLKAEYAMAIFRLAQITADVSSEREGIKLHEQAIKVFLDLPAAEANAPENQAALASCWHHVGRLYRRMDDYAKAENALQKALAIWVPLTVAHPEVDSYQAELARSRLVLGSVYMQRRRLDDAKEMYAKAFAGREKLAQKHPDGAEYQRDLAVSDNDLGLVFTSLGDAEKAEAYLRDAIKIQEKLVQRHKEVIRYRNELARSYYNLGHVLRSSDFAKAWENYDKAEKLWRALQYEYPMVIEFRMKRGESYAVRARLYRNHPDPERWAEWAAKRALAIQESLVNEYGDTPEHRDFLARAYWGLGDVYRAYAKQSETVSEAKEAYQQAGLILEKLRNDPQYKDLERGYRRIIETYREHDKKPQDFGTAAQENYGKAVEILKKLVKEHPDVPRYQADLAGTYNSIGLFWAQQRDEKKAREAYSIALALWDELVQTHRGEPEFIRGQSNARHNFADVLSGLAKYSDALDWYGKALRALETLTPEQRQEAPVQPTVRNIQTQRAEALTAMGRHQEAIEAWDRALEVAGPYGPRLRLKRALTLARAGEHQQAAAEADALLANARVGEAFYQLGSVFALSTGAAAVDGKLGQDERQTIADEYAARAVEMLHKAVAVKFFDKVENRNLLNKDKDLEALRGRPQFQKLLDMVEQRAKAKDAGTSLLCPHARSGVLISAARSCPNFRENAASRLHGV